MILSKWLSSSIWSIDGTLTGMTNLDQIRPERNGNEWGNPYSPEVNIYFLTRGLQALCNLASLAKSDCELFNNAEAIYIWYILFTEEIVFKHRVNF